MDKSNNIKRLLGFLAALAAIALVVTIALRSRGGKPPVLVPRLPLKVGVSLNGVHLTETKQGQKKWDLSAEKAEFNRENNTTSLSKVDLVFVERSAGEFRVTADRADYDNATKDVRLVGHVRGEGSKGTRFSTDSVRYVAALSRLETADRVYFSEKGMVLEGVGMRFWIGSRKLQLLGDVSAHFGGGR